MNNSPSIWKSRKTNELVSAFVGIDNPKLMKAFIRDIMTEKEIIELSNRLLAAEMLIDSEKYSDVALITGLSSRTIARISEWIKKGNGGYRQVINNLRKHSLHIMPVRD